MNCSCLTKKKKKPKKVQVKSLYKEGRYGRKKRKSFFKEG